MSVGMQGRYKQQYLQTSCCAYFIYCNTTVFPLPTGLIPQVTAQNIHAAASWIGFTRKICICLHRCIIDVFWHFYFIFCVQVSETTSSPMMEPLGFRRRESYPDLRHQFDPWHVAKG